MQRTVFIYFSVLLLVAACAGSRTYDVLPQYPAAEERLTGTDFFARANLLSIATRDSLATSEILKGNFPRRMNRWVSIQSSIQAPDGNSIVATYQVTADYLSLGTDADWCRVPLTPMAGQRIADAWGCFLPTQKIVDAIYQAAKVKLEPVPMYAYRDSPVAMFQHHLIIEGQRKGREGLIAGIKKDVVLSPIVPAHAKPNREAIYGWHRMTGKAIQPLYAGHVNWYVDYSHGIRLIRNTILVNGKKMDYRDVLKDTLLRSLLTDESAAPMLRYDTSAPIPRL
ncbi:MAG: hypothetical protein ACKOOA_00160 [Sediminibacterium sp.]